MFGRGSRLKVGFFLDSERDELFQHLVSFPLLIRVALFVPLLTSSDEAAIQE
jgi:hypothetical protein